MKQAIKIQLVKVVPMSKEGVKRWNPALRHKVTQVCFKAQRGETVRLDQIDTKKKMAHHVWLYYGPGRWQLRAPCPNKHARYGFSMKTLVEMELIQVDPHNEYKYLITDWKEKRLNRYKKMLNWEGRYK